MFGLTILGNNSAVPAHNRHPTSQALFFEDQVFLIDCGEGTQMQLDRYQVKKSKINHIFISHLHGDHFFGLIGLLNSMGLLNRKNPLWIYAPEELFPLLDWQIKISFARIFFPIHYVAITQPGVLLETPKMAISCFPVKHLIPCWGFLFTEKKFPRKINADAVIEAGIPIEFYSDLQLGKDFMDESGRVIENSLVTHANNKGRKYAYCADTCFDLSLCEYVQGVDLLYHEATYLHNMEKAAKERYHSTTKQAALFGKTADTKKLIIGHFSSQYENISPFLEEAREIFEFTSLALEGETFLIKH